MDKIIENMPLVDLHLHIDGALGIEKVYEIIKRDNLKFDFEINSIEDVKNKMMVSDDCQDLNEFLEKFDLPLKMMQTKEHITELTEELVIRLAESHIVYAELRFAPQLHRQEGLLMDEVVEAAIEGINLGMNKNDNIKVKLILCMMRGASIDDNRDTITSASKYLGKGVCGIDLAGAEGLYATEDYRELFESAKDKNVPFTIHAGEADGPKSIKTAVDFGTSRIGHGIKLIEDEKLYEEIRNKSVLLEVCPISNLKTKGVEKIEDHPIKKFFDDNLNVCICSDDMTVQGSTLREEYELLKNTFDFEYKDFIKMNVNAIKSSFMDEKDKITYVKLLEEYLI